MKPRAVSVWRVSATTSPPTDETYDREWDARSRAADLLQAHGGKTLLGVVVWEMGGSGETTEAPESHRNGPRSDASPVPSVGGPLGEPIGRQIEEPRELS